MHDQVYCRFCDYNPCMCGRRTYMTEPQRLAEERSENEKRQGEDRWALPANPLPGFEDIQD